MNKTLFLLLFVSLISCEKKEKKAPNSIGKLNQIAVIVDDQLWNGEIGDSIRNKMASPVLGLSQEEPLFTLNQYPVKLFEGFMNNSRNIIIIKKEDKSEFRIEKNEFVNPQIVVHISGRTNQDIIDTLQVKDSLIIAKIKNSERLLFQNKIAHDSLLNTKKITKKFNIKVNIPVNYQMVMKTKKFVWLKKEITSGSLSLLFYKIPFSSIKKTDNIVNRITKIRDSIGYLYIHGAVPHTRMVTEPAFSPYLFKTIISGRMAFETKGNWELTTDSMSGPFVNYSIIDEKNKRILVVEGFCYAPSKQKRDLMFELETIIKSIQFLKTNK